MFDLSGKVALVTGATGGIGSSICRLLSEKGATVVGTGTREKELDKVIGGLGNNAHAISCDLRSNDSIQAFLQKLEAIVGVPDILVNNAGITRDNLFIRMKEEQFDEVLELNLKSVFKVTKYIIKGMVKRKSGRIISISSVVGSSGNPGQVNYSASKAGLEGFTKSLALEVASRGITVNCIAPGLIKSPMTDALSDERKDNILKTIPCGIFGAGDDVAAALVFLASDEASYITGQTIHVNGGIAMY